MDDVLKQRLIGAAVLIALAVIFIPMFFHGPDDRVSEQTLDPQMPSSPMAERQVRRLPLNPNASRTNESEQASDAVEISVPAQTGPSPSQTKRVALDPSNDAATSLASEQPAPEQPASEPIEQSSSNVVEESFQTPEETPTDEREIASDSTPSTSQTPSMDASDPAEESDKQGDAWRVQVASFSAQATAQSVAESVQEAGYSSQVERLVRGQSVLYRVQAGPFSSRNEAEDARATIDGLIAGVSPVVRAPIEGTPAKVEPGFAVQVGSFTESDNAQRLESQLISQGFQAFSFAEQVGDRTIWRVRVGTVETREAAEGLASRLKEQASLEGLVVSHP